MTSSLTIPISARRRKFFEGRPEPREEYPLLNGPEWTGFPPTAAGSIYRLSAHLRLRTQVRINADNARSASSEFPNAASHRRG